ncbi:unnamed protein product [Laminaria digitata]
MKSLYVAAACVAATFFAGATGVSAHEPGKKHGMSGHHAMSEGVQIESAWARATPGLARNGGAYFVAKNGGKDADRIVGASADVSAKVEVHTHINDNGIMRMREVEGVDVPAGGEVVFKPGGYHIMLIGLKKPLKKGERFPMTLKFEKAGKKTVEVTVMGVGAMKGGMKHDMKSKHGGH